jgi:hypothetical protein
MSNGHCCRRIITDCPRGDEFDGGDVLCVGGQPGAEPDEQQLRAGQRLGNGQRQLHVEQRDRAGDGVAQRLSYGNDLLFTNAQAGGEMKFYQFNVPAGIASIEVRWRTGWAIR